MLACEMKVWTSQMRAVNGSTGSTTDDNVKSLRDIDSKIAGLSALFSIQKAPQSATGSSLSTEALLSRCELALKD